VLDALAQARCSWTGPSGRTSSAWPGRRTGPPRRVAAVSADPGLSLVVYGAEPGSASQDGLHLLARRAATLDQAATAQTPDQA
jgi:hypothetical protein